MLSLLWLLATNAHGWTLDPQVVALDGAPLDVVVAMRPEGPRIVVGRESSVDVFGPDGIRYAEIAAGGAAVGLRDQDGDGLDDLLVCGSSGFLVVLWPASGPEAPFVVDPTPCTALSAHALDGATGVATADTAVRLWWDDGAGGFTGPDDGGFSIVDPWLAAQDDVLVAVDPLETSLEELGPFGISSIAAGGEVVGFGRRDDWVVSLSDGNLREFGGEVVALGQSGGVAVGDVDGDGLIDLVVLQESAVVVVPGNGDPDVISALDFGAIGVVADLDADGCGDLVGIGASELILARVADCTFDDFDGDGWDGSAGDCDDADASVHPGAREDCDGVDDDCDGAIDETGRPAVNAPAQADEGETIVAWADVEGCDTGWLYVWTPVEAPWASCSAIDRDMTCVFADDGELTLQVDATGPDGASYSAWATVEVHNVAPIFVITDDSWTDDLSNAVVYVVENQPDTYTVAAQDPGSDELTFSVENVDEALDVRVSPGGIVSIEGLWAGTYRFDLVVFDDDGGEAFLAVTVSVENADTGDDDGFDAGEFECGPICDTSGLCCGTGVLAFGAGMRRRRRS